MCVLECVLWKISTHLGALCMHTQLENRSGVVQVCSYTHRMHTDVCKNKQECQGCVHLFLGNTFASPHPNRYMEEVGW